MVLSKDSQGKNDNYVICTDEPHRKVTQPGLLKTKIPSGELDGGSRHSTF